MTKQGEVHHLAVWMSQTIWRPCWFNKDNAPSFLAYFFTDDRMTLGFWSPLCITSGDFKLKPNSFLPKIQMVQSPILPRFNSPASITLTNFAQLLWIYTSLKYDSLSVVFWTMSSCRVGDSLHLCVSDSCIVQVPDFVLCACQFCVSGEGITAGITFSRPLCPHHHDATFCFSSLFCLLFYLSPWMDLMMPTYTGDTDLNWVHQFR